MDPFEENYCLYDTCTIQRYLKKYHSINMTIKEIDCRMTQVIIEEIEEEERYGKITERSDIDDLDWGSKMS